MSLGENCADSKTDTKAITRTLSIVLLPWDLTSTVSSMPSILSTSIGTTGKTMNSRKLIWATLLLDFWASLEILEGFCCGRFSSTQMSYVITNDTWARMHGNWS